MQRGLFQRTAKGETLALAKVNHGGQEYTSQRVWAGDCE